METYSTFTGEALKSNIGPDDWKRFFALVASSIAINEKSPIVPSTPDKSNELIGEMRSLYHTLNVYKVLSGWSAATKHTQDQRSEAAMYLLVLDSNTFHVTVSPYKSGELAAANIAYAEIERNSPKLQAVLVSVDSLAALRTAYPNYFLDTTNFINVVRKAIGDE